MGDALAYAEQVAVILDRLGMKNVIEPYPSFTGWYSIRFTSPEWSNIPIGPIKDQLPDGGFNTGISPAVISPDVYASGISPAQWAQMFASKAVETIDNLKKLYPTLGKGYWDKDTSKWYPSIDDVPKTPPTPQPFVPPAGWINVMGVWMPPFQVTSGVSGLSKQDVIDILNKTTVVQEGFGFRLKVNQ